MRLLLMLLVFAIAPTARAWDAGGHEIVAAIAYAHLNAKARAAVDHLAPQVERPAHPYDFITLACWMDDLRNDPTLADYGRFKSWHYIDLPIDPRDPEPSFVPGTDNDIHGDAVQALKRALVVLEGGTDPYVRNQSMALAMIEHLVGDIHQPLHCATKYFISHRKLRDDKGGNDEFVLNGPPGDRKFNLHAFWDSAWRASFDDSSGDVVLDERYHVNDWLDPASVRDLAAGMDRLGLPPNESNLNSAFENWAVLRNDTVEDFDSWARESNAIARDFVYPGITATDNAKYCRLSSAYVSHAHDVARIQLATAGHSLAVLLNTTLGADKPLPVPTAYPAGSPASEW